MVSNDKTIQAIFQWLSSSFPLGSIIKIDRAQMINKRKEKKITFQFITAALKLLFLPPIQVHIAVMNAPWELLLL